MLFFRLSLIHREHLTTHVQYVCSLKFPFTPFSLLIAELIMCNPSLMHTQIRLLIGKEESGGGLNGPEHFSQEPHYIHDEMIDASPCQVQTISMIL
jgi:hypothetical protein